MKHFAADAGSMVAVDKDGEVLFAYFAHAIQDESTIGPRWATLAQFLDEEIDLKDIPRYPGPKGRTLDNVTKDTKYDGLQVSCHDSSILSYSHDLLFSGATSLAIMLSHKT